MQFVDWKNCTDFMPCALSQFSLQLRCKCCLNFWSQSESLLARLKDINKNILKNNHQLQANQPIQPKLGCLYRPCINGKENLERWDVKIRFIRNSYFTFWGFPFTFNFKDVVNTVTLISCRSSSWWKPQCRLKALSYILSFH